MPSAKSACIIPSAVQACVLGWQGARERGLTGPSVPRAGGLLPGQRVEVAA